MIFANAALSVGMALRPALVALSARSAEARSSDEVKIDRPTNFKSFIVSPEVIV
jgi:hypothetical protein